MKRVARVELFYAQGCRRCAAARAQLRAAAEDASEVQVEWHEVDIAANPQRVVELGVVSTPAIAINGALRFKTVPSSQELREALEEAS